MDYATNGVKVDEVASRVGMGWSLRAGGVITRTTYGLPDDITGVYRHKPASHSDTSWAMYYFLLNNVEPADPQPDEYNFSFDGYSGKFIIVDGEIKQLKYSGIKFQKLSTDIFLATTPNGFQYYFGENLAYEETKSDNYNEFERPTIYDKAKSAWYLTRLISTTNDTLLFNYTGASSFAFTGASEYYSPVLPNTTSSILYYNFYAGFISVPTYYRCYASEQIHTSFHTSSGSVRLLDEIIFNNGKVKFNYSEREDITGDKRIDSIQILNKNGNINKTLKFSYVYSNSISTAYDNKYSSTTLQALYPVLRKRLFLTGIEETASENIAGSKYGFEYNDIDQLPSRLSFSQDLTGYFNGKRNMYFFPNNTYVDDLFFNQKGGGPIIRF